MYVYESAEGGAQIATMDMPWGENLANAVYLPGDERDEDKIVFYDNDMKPHSRKDKFMVSFETDGAQLYMQRVRMDPAP